MFDDTFMSAVFDGQIEETQFLIRVILNRDDIDVIESKAQFFISNTYGHGVRLDIRAQDKEGRVFHFEVERNKERASAQRARFTGALVDIQLLKRNQDFKEIPDRYTIFITEEDRFGAGLPIYHAENKVAELGDAPLGDGSHIIYVNGTYRNTETPIGQLIHDFSCKDPNDIMNKVLRDRVSFLKNTEGGRDRVCQIMEKRIDEEKIELAKRALETGKYTPEEVSFLYELPIAFVEELARKEPAVFA